MAAGCCPVHGTDQSLELEKALLEAVWEQLDRISTKERFSFEAVVIFLRWNPVFRWTTYNSEIAIGFDQLVENALGEFASELRNNFEDRLFNEHRINQ